MRFLIAGLLLVSALLGAAFAALNSSMFHYDFLVVSGDLPGGATLLAALVLGWLLGGVTAWLGIGMRRRGGRGSHKQDDRQDAA